MSKGFGVGNVLDDKETTATTCRAVLPQYLVGGMERSTNSSLSVTPRRSQFALFVIVRKRQSSMNIITQYRFDDQQYNPAKCVSSYGQCGGPNQHISPITIPGTVLSLCHAIIVSTSYNKYLPIPWSLQSIARFIIQVGT